MRRPGGIDREVLLFKSGDVCIIGVTTRSGRRCAVADLMDYLDWRGDLTFSQSPFNEVDNLILAELSFVDLRGIAPGVGGGAGVPLRDAAERYFAAGRDKTLESSVLVPEQIPAMLERSSLPRWLWSCRTARPISPSGGRTTRWWAGKRTSTWPCGTRFRPSSERWTT